MRSLTVVSLIALAAIYIPGLGHGLIKDDYAWVAGSQVESWRHLGDLWTRHNGFYRPMVSLSFWANHEMFGVDPGGYGWTNLALFAACIAAVGALARSVGMPPGVSAFTALLWAFNPHGINMAVLWNSGRTALLLVLFTVLCAIEWIGKRPLLAAFWYLLALFSKEESTLLPAVLLVWGYVQERGPGRSAALVLRSLGLRVLPLAVCLGLYAWLRGQTGAYTPGSAPPFYRLAFDVTTLAANIVQYADRACTLSAVVVLAVWVLVRKRPHLEDQQWRWAVMGLAWLLFGFAITVLLPVRSSLYACFPSIGSVLVAGALLAGFDSHISSRTRRRLALAAVTVTLLLIPVYWSRNARWIQPARVASTVVAEITPVAALADSILLIDDMHTRNNLRGAFGTNIQDALRLMTGKQGLRIWVEPPLDGWELAGLVPLTPSERSKTLQLAGGHLVEARPPDAASPGSGVPAPSPSRPPDRPNASTR